MQASRTIGSARRAARTSNQRRWRIAPVAAALVAIGAPLSLVAAAGGAAAGTVRLSHAAPVHFGTPRPSTCPAQSGDPNTANDGATPTQLGTFPWPPAPAGVDPEQYAASALHTTAVHGVPERPANWGNGGVSWKLTSARTTQAGVATNPQELCGVEGTSVDKAWEVSTGRPDTVIAVTDSGIEWCSADTADKVALNRAALPYPEDGSGVVDTAHPWDPNGSGVFDVAQYRNDPRVLGWTTQHYGGLFCGSYITAEDLIRTFGNPASPWYYPVAGSNGTEQPSYPGQSPAGFTEAIAGWNFVDDTNDPYDDVLYGHGTGEARDSTAAADGTGDVGSCPNCMVLPLRVGESFIAEGNDFARAVLFAVDSGVKVLQEALGTIDVTTTAAQAIAYADAHGVPVIASAADEEAEHHNEPGDLPGTIVVNSVTQADEGQNVTGQTVALQNPAGYLHLNGCTNYGANIAVSVESSSCSSEATGKSAGVAGLLESEAENLLVAGKLAPYPGTESALGQPVALSSTELRELIEATADDVDFQRAVVPPAAALAAGTTTPAPPDNYAEVGAPPTTRYPTQPGYDQYTGYGRLDAAGALAALAGGAIPPEASFGEMQWFQTYDPRSTTVPVPIDAAAVRTPGTYHWALQYGIGPQPEPGKWIDITGGTGTGGPAGTAIATTASLTPALLEHIARQLPPSVRGTGADGRPAPDAPAFTLRLVVTDAKGRVGVDRRTEYLVHDPTLLAEVQPDPSGPGVHPVTQPATDFGGSVDAAPTLAPIGPGGTDALVVATADGTIHAFAQSTGGSGTTLRELPGWPVHTALLPGQAAIGAAERAYTSGEVTAQPHCTIVGGIAVGDIVPGMGHDVAASDMCGNVYVWDAQGALVPGYPVHTVGAYSSDPAPYVGTPSATVGALDPRDPQNRVLPGILGAPALADLTGTGQLDVVVSSLDRHVYAWDPHGQPVPGYPVLVVDPATVASVDPTTNHVTFKKGVDVQMGSMILDTPAVGDLAGRGGPPDLVVGTDEEYGCNPATVPGADLAVKAGLPPCAISVANAVSYTVAAAGSSLLNPANSRVYALSPAGTHNAGTGSCAAGTAQPDACAILPGWPASMVDLDAGLLPDVGDGTTATPALADLAGDGRLEVGDMTTVGPAYIFGPTGSSYLGTGPDGQPVSLSMVATGPLANSHDLPSIPSLGMPVFAPLLPAGAPSFIAPATSLGKALDAALADDQPNNDNQLDAWSPSTGTMLPGFPQVMDDLQFFDQPIVADVGGVAAGPYVVEGSANADLRAVNSAGVEAPGFPKFTGDWIVNSPSFGPFGTLAHQVVVAGTRHGDLFVWATPTAPCAPSGPWPREHHDLSNTDDLQGTASLGTACGASSTAPLAHRTAPSGSSSHPARTVAPAHAPSGTGPSPSTPPSSTPPSSTPPSSTTPSSGAPGRPAPSVTVPAVPGVGVPAGKGS
jgi:hypothetical protein